MFHHAPTSPARSWKPWIAGAALLAAAALQPALAQAPAQDFPNRPVRLVVNFPPGGPLDILARQLATDLTGTWKQPVTVENIGGAAGAIGANKVAQAEPDGYTVLMTIDAPFTSTAALSPKTAPDLNSFRPVGILGVTGLTVAVHPSTGVNSLPELIQRGRQNPVTFSTAGIGSPGHFTALMLAEATGMKVTSVHYRGNAPAVQALLSGEVQAGALGSTGLLPHVRADKLKPLAVVGQERSSVMPDLKTTAELGFPSVRLDALFLAMVPAKTPDAVVNRLYKDMSDAIKSPQVQQRLKAMDIAGNTSPGPQSAKTLEDVRTRYEAIVKSTGMKPEQ